MVQYVEHDTLVNELVALENFSPEERLAHARRRRQDQIKSYDIRERTPGIYPPHHASHNKNIRFDKNIELIEAASRNDFEEGKRTVWAVLFYTVPVNPFFLFYWSVLLSCFLDIFLVYIKDFSNSSSSEIHLREFWGFICDSFSDSFCLLPG